MTRICDEDDAHELEGLVEEILVDATGEDEQLRAFLQVFEDSVQLPADAFVIGQPVSVVAIDHDGNTRRGLTAACQQDGDEHVVGLSEVRFPESSEGARYVAAYRKWLGIEPAVGTPASSRPAKRHKAKADDIDLNEHIELVVLAMKERAARCRILGTGREITLRPSELWNVIPGEVVTVRPRKQWSYAGHPYVSGEIEKSRIDIPVLGLTPLRLRDEGMWDPAEQYWGEEGEPLEEWAMPIVERGPRPQFEMEQVLPGSDPDDPDTDPILEANDLRAAGDTLGARKVLASMLAVDLRCLDAHAHLGNYTFEHLPEEALRHYEVGVRIGELALGEGFDGVLPWGLVDNRPFLRCLHGFGLGIWKLGRTDEAAAVFERMLWLNPSDNQGARALLFPARAGEPWEKDEDGELP